MSLRTRPGAEAFRMDAGPDAVLLIHGFSGSPASTRPIGEYLAGHGYSVVGVRLPGHGGTNQDLVAARWPDWEREVHTALEELSNRSRSVSLVGVSFGGALALHAAAVHPEIVSAVVLINPYVRDARLAVTPVARFLLPSLKGIGNDIKKPGQDELCNDRLALGTLASMSAFHRKVRHEMPSVRAPLLVFSATDDHTVKPANSSLVMERVGSERTELVRLANSYHVATLDYDADLICARTLAFLSSIAAGTPAQT